MGKSFYILVKSGVVQNTMVSGPAGHPVKAFMVAESIDDANKLVDYLGVRSQGVRPALIGSVDGETLEGHLALAIEDGCELIICPQGWNDDKSPIWGVIGGS
jgi:hypothetical protein